MLKDGVIQVLQFRIQGFNFVYCIFFGCFTIVNIVTCVSA